MKRVIKKIVSKMPGIKGFLLKWRRVRKDIQRLKKRDIVLKKKITKQEKQITKQQKQILRQQKQIHNLMNQIKVLTEVTNRNALHNELSNKELYRNTLLETYERCSDTNGVFSEEEEQLVNGINYLKNARPLVSIIMLNRNGKHNLEVLMNSFHERQFYDNFEIICVDNASSDDSLEYLATWKDEFKIKIIQNHENMSFSAANNLGVKEADGEYLLFLNNDIEVTDGWLDELILAMRKVENIGAVGAKLIYPQIPKNTINAGKSYSIQHSGIAFRDSIRDKQYFIQPYNMDNGVADYQMGTELIERACVTAAVLMMTRTAFEKIGGFDENYIYGYEDVDICLKLLKAGYHNYLCPTSVLYHYEFGTQNRDVARDVRIRRRHNMDVFRGKWQSYLSRKVLEDKIYNRHIYTEEQLTVALVVTEDKLDTTAGDFFTAMELANSLTKLGYKIKYLSRRGKKDWYDVGIEVDVLISLLDAYDITQAYNKKNDLITIAWARNWFERWCEKDYFDLFSMVFASSKTACRYIDDNSNQQAILFPIATNQDRFYIKEEIKLSKEDFAKYHSDYAFTGSYWNVKREIIDYLNPDKMDYDCKIYGVNWESIDKFRDYTEGFVLYEDMPKIYHNTKVVIDDANHVTKKFGAVNSRVFDALAAGTLVMTNGIKGAEETFEGMLPCFDTIEDFEKKLSYYLEHDKERLELVSKLQNFVLEKHTYDVRAEKLRELLLEYNKDSVDEKRIDILGAMPSDETKKFWGDQHFAIAMQKEFEELGYKARVVARDCWFDRSDAKYIIVLRGAKEYYPSVNDGRKYIMWNISHPLKVTIDEYNLYDFVYFASEKMYKEIGPQIRPESGVLLQCVDDKVMTYVEKNEKEYELLFVGNSRHVFRKILRDLLPTEHKLSVYGRHWEEYPVQEYVVNDYMDNDKVGQAYHDAKILLNDHWDDMREYGIISNRIFDALAVGAFVISDYIPEIDTLFDGAVVTYQTKEDLKEKVDYYLEHDEEREKLAKRGQEIVLSQHTFKERVGAIIRVLENK